MSESQPSAHREKRPRRRWIVKLLALALLVYVGWSVGYPRAFRWYTGEKTARIEFPSSREISRGEFRELERQIYEENIARSAASVVELETDPIYKRVRLHRVQKLRSQRDRLNLHHIERFREAGIMQYEGPRTCLKCHEEMKVMWPEGVRTVDTMEDVINTSHFRFFRSDKSDSTYGYSGGKVNGSSTRPPIPAGKIGRAWGVTGTFTWTGWAQLIRTLPEEADGEVVLRSEGCGQCHIGGMYGPPTDMMMPFRIRDKNRENAIDCLICHSASYDMNERYVVDDGIGLRWNQDRSMKAALSVTRPQARMCLRCHQHNMGGDMYHGNEAARSLGYENPRLLHAAKRGTAYGPAEDVHARAGLDCLDCHTARGHKIARGRAGVDLVSNDLPDVDVSCELCHTDAPHYRDPRASAMLNGHTARVACETCHITRLSDDNMVLVDWLDPIWDPTEGLYVPRLVLKTGDPREAIEYLWFNSKGTLFSNALGANPNGNVDYNPLMEQLRRYKKIPGLVVGGGGVRNNDFLFPLSDELREKRKQMIEENLRPVMNSGTSKIYPFKLFNARMFEDMNNQGPFGSMILPFDYATYYETGDARKAMEAAMQHPIVKRMYEMPIKLYLMDQFMEYLGAEPWKPIHPLSAEYAEAGGRIEGHWMRQFGTLMVNHGISRDGLSCEGCHVAEGGYLDWRALGYSDDKIEELTELPEPIIEKATEFQRAATEVEEAEVAEATEIVDELAAGSE
jgi:hypothetical protein